MAEYGNNGTPGASFWDLENDYAALDVTVTGGENALRLRAYVQQIIDNPFQIKGAIYSGTTKVAETQVATLTGTNAPAWYDLDFVVPPALAATTYRLVIGGSSGSGAVQYGYATGTGYYEQNTYSHPTMPTTLPDLGASSDRRPFLYLVTESSSGITGTCAATETGADTCAASGNVGNNGLRLTLRDTDTGALAANLTGVIVSVRAASNAGTLLFTTTSETTNASGILEIANSAIGNIGDYVYVTVEKSDHSLVTAYRIQVIDLNA